MANMSAAASEILPPVALHGGNTGPERVCATNMEACEESVLTA